MNWSPVILLALLLLAILGGCELVQRCGAAEQAGKYAVTIRTNENGTVLYCIDPKPANVMDAVDAMQGAGILPPMTNGAVK